MTVLDRKNYLSFLREWIPGFGAVAALGGLIILIVNTVETNDISQRTQIMLQKAMITDSFRPITRARLERVETKIDQLLLNQSQGQTRAVIRDSKIDSIKAAVIQKKH